MSRQGRTRIPQYDVPGAEPRQPGLRALLPAWNEANGRHTAQQKATRRHIGDAPARNEANVGAGARPENAPARNEANRASPPQRPVADVLAVVHAVEVDVLHGLVGAALG